MIQAESRVTLRRNPYHHFLDQVEKPARYIGGEHNLIRKPWERTLSKIALCFPDTYEIGMSHLGFKILYEELNKTDNILAERVFAPWIDMEAKMREHKAPLVSLESFRPLSEFQVLGFSLQYEMTYTNILNMLDLGGVSIWQKDRKEEEPFVICGGPCATHPEPLAPFMDFVVVGDGEDLFARLGLFIGEARKQGMKRKEILSILSKWKGIYVPSLYTTEVDPLNGLEVVTGVKEEGIPETVERFFVEDLKNYPIPTESPIAHMTAIFDRFSVELSRGCTEGCRFCQAGMIYRPVRERRPEDVIDSVMKGMEKGGFKEASLTCLSTADYSAITPLLIDLLDKVHKEKGTLGISSLRAYGLDNRIFDKMSEVKNTSLTFAPEAGTERMRKVINKNISEEDMLQTATDVFSRGWKKMKLYFMIGLPTETDEDVQGIMETGLKARGMGRRVGVKNPTVTISVSSFVPKPHTPFQWHSMITFKEIERKQEMLFKLSRDYRLNFRKHLSKTSYMECMIARGDRKIADVIYSAWEKGCRFDGWEETFKFDAWMEAVEENQIEIANYMGTIRLDSRLPWDHISVGLEPKFLEREWKKALKDRLSPPCGKPAGAIVHHSNLEALERTHTEEKKRLVCYHCGVACDLQGMVDERREFLTSLKSFKDEPYVAPENIGSGQSRIKMSEKRGQKVGHKYRITFSKLGPISFISHLDLQKIIARIFRRAQIKTLVSEGYNPRPLISFGPALSLGISSLEEFFDVRVEEPWENEKAILDLLNSHSEQGISFSQCSMIEKRDPSIQEAIKSFSYFLPVSDAEGLSEKVEKLLKQDELMISSFNKGKKAYEQKDVRGLILKAQVENLSLEEKTMRLIDEVSPCAGRPGIKVEAKVRSGSSIRPQELVGLFTEAGMPVERPIKVAARLHEG